MKGKIGAAIDCCPLCEGASWLVEIFETADIPVRGELIRVDARFLKCPDCGEKFFANAEGEDPIGEAYKVYRDKYDMVTPEELKRFRNRLHLTQRQFANLLGWGTASVSRYETGALARKSHDKQLQKLMGNPDELKLLMESSFPGNLTPARKKALAELVNEPAFSINSLKWLFQNQPGFRSPSIFNGFKLIDLVKVYNTILYLCKVERFEGALYKLLWYTDFFHFKEANLSVTGLTYAALDFGPCPEKHRVLFDLLEAKGLINTRERFFENGVSGTLIKSAVDPNETIFTDSELRALRCVVSALGDYTAAELSRKSHNEKGYLETPRYKLISYKYSKELSML